MASHDTVEARIELPDGLLDELRTYIAQPETRRRDVLWEVEMPVDDGHQRLQVIVKHDLFEGVLLVLNLMGSGRYDFVAGETVALSDATDLAGTHELQARGKTYRVTLDR